MESILHKITFLYKDMGPAEKKIADYILQHTQDIVGTSISELAACCGCGDATVVRFFRSVSMIYPSRCNIRSPCWIRRSWNRPPKR